MGAAILALTLARFSGPGRAAGHAQAWASCLSQSKEQHRRLVDLAVTFAVLVTTLLLLTFMGDAAARRPRPPGGTRDMRATAPHEPQSPAALQVRDLQVRFGISRWCTA